MNLFLDSGAHSLYTEHMIKTNHRHGYQWSDTPEFWGYVDDYAKFIKKHEKYLTVYVNVDVIFNPEQTYKVQKYLEKKYNLSPMPVVHHGTDLYWLKKYMDEGYEYIGIGGLGQEVSKATYFAWADKVFDMICDQPSRMPKVKTHGFAMTSIELIRRYPWYSVDSTTWVLIGRMGGIFVPQYKDGQWNYLTDTSWKVSVSNRSPDKKKAGQHIDTLPPKQRKIILKYIHERGYKLGKSEFRKEKQNYKLKENERWAGKKPKGSKIKRMVETIIEPGLSNTYQLRDEMNIMYFLDLEKALPKWPWPFKQTGVKGFDF